MKTKTLVSLILISFTTFFSCDDSTTSGGAGGLACVTLASDVTVEPMSDMCTTAVGKWTQYTVDTVVKTAIKACDIEEASIYADQAAFNATEGTSTVEGVTVSSREDYIKTATCASGSIHYVTIGSDTDFLFIWEKKL